ncbi:MAG TPA: L,D-transpeptidase [Thermoanaerobaculia bacterium]|nr:L,D-transpeptidase [Thermoanaerobaculia bacterium]
MSQTPKHRSTLDRRLVLLAAFLLALLPVAAGAAAPAPDAAGLEIVVNVPAGELAVLQDGVTVRTYPVTVGVRGHATPVGEFNLTRTVWNPWWHPPNSAWARNKRPQPPGPNNAMGRAKLYFKPLYFIHGTAETDKLGRPASHGCVRMANEDVIELAKLVHRYATPDVAPETLAALEADPKETKEFGLDRPVPLRIVYELVEVRGNQVVVHPDVYRRVSRDDLTEQVVLALAEHGESVLQVDRAHVAELVKDVHRDGGTLSVDRLLAGPAESAVAAAGR